MARTAKIKPKRAYFCTADWYHELGSTEAIAYGSPKIVPCRGCGVVEARVTYVRTVKKENLELPGAFVPIRRMKHEQLKSIRQDIARLQRYYKRVKSEPSIEQILRKRKKKK